MKRMYILVLNDVALGTAVNSACHAAVACALKYQDTPEVQEWLDDSFRKVTCSVTWDQLNLCMAREDDWVPISEINLDYRLVAVAFKPRDEYHKCFKFLTLFGKDYVKEL